MRYIFHFQRITWEDMKAAGQSKGLIKLWVRFNSPPKIQFPQLGLKPWVTFGQCGDIKPEDRSAGFNFRLEIHSI